MTTSLDSVAKERPLESLGISEPEERVYRWLLKHRNASMAEMGRALSLTPTTTQRLLEALESKGLATHTPERPRRYIPASPDVALSFMVAQRQRVLQNVQTIIEELQSEAMSEHLEEHEQIVELITAPEAEHQIYERMMLMAQHEILGLVKPPLRSSRLDIPAGEDHPTQREAHRRGVHIRSVVDSEFMALSGAVTSVSEDVFSGEEIRVFPKLPFKMVLSDRKIALVPLDLTYSEGPSLLVKSSALLDALRLLFEFIWERSSPIRLSGSRLVETELGGSKLDEQTRELVSLMAAGLNDKSIFMESGISRRTHQKHVTELMEKLNARTRFQAGWLAALQLVAEGRVPIKVLEPHK